MSAFRQPRLRLPRWMRTWTFAHWLVLAVVAAALFIGGVTYVAISGDDGPTEAQAANQACVSHGRVFHVDASNAIVVCRDGTALDIPGYG